ncbi:MAG: IS21 family transposase [Myxococcota bacterium]|nr:IS21 family transposase [Myxococcota bacterium]
MNEARRLLAYEVVRRVARGESKRGIARALKIAPRTVTRIVREQTARRTDGESALDRELPAKRTPRSSKLDAYDEQIAAWLERYPDLTATRLHEKLCGEGFTGAYTIVREHMKVLRADRTPKRAFERVETAPGLQGQFDWSPFALESGEIENVWSYTLSWSRGRSFAADDNQRQTTILRRLHESFAQLQGVPRESVTDTMSGVVDGWECNQPILNIRFVDFAAYYRFAVHVSPRRYPPYKGKVERPFRYIDENFCNGRTFSSREAFREGLAWWRDTHAMQRPHPVTGRTLAEMLDEERPYLQPLPRVPYDTRDVVQRHVDSTAHILYETNSYPVPEKYIGQLVYVCVGPDRLEVFDRGVHAAAELERIPDGTGKTAASDRKRRGRYDVTLLQERFAAWGPLAEDFATKLRLRKRAPGPELDHILKLQVTWSVDDLVAAIEHATKYGAFEARAVERILEARHKPRRLAEQIADATRSQIREAMREHPVEQRALSSYETLRVGDDFLREQREEEELRDKTIDEAEPG